jgi:hypothetical protein
MKTYCIVSETNFGKMVHIVNAGSKKEARTIAEKEGAWEYADIQVVDTLKAGCVFSSG